MVDPCAPNSADRRASDYRKRVVQWGEQQILKDYTLHLDHPSRLGVWRGPSPLAITYAQALLIYEALSEDYPNAFDVLGQPDRDEKVDSPSEGSDRVLPPLPNEHVAGMDTSANGVHRRSGRDTRARPQQSTPHEAPSPSPNGSPQKNAAASATSYSKTVHYHDEPRQVQISREVVLTDRDWDGSHRPSLHVHEEGALLKMSGHPITEFTSPHALRTMAALFARAASEMERGEWND